MQIQNNHEIDRNDFDFIQNRYGKILAFVPGSVDQKTGKINPQVTTAWMGGNVFTSVFHIKPVYYETIVGTWRPLYEVTKFHGNKNIIFSMEGFRNVHPRYVDWLVKRCALLGGQVSVESFVVSPFVQSVHDLLTIPKIGLTTTTVYPDPDPETTTCDGIAWEETATATWSTMRNAAGDSGYATGGAGTLRLFAIWADGSNYRQNARSFFLFDTSAIGDTDTIDSATLSIKVYDKVDPASKAPDSNIYTATPSSNTNIVAGDYAQTGTTAQCDTAVTYANMTANVYADWAFNATGLGNISKTGVSKFSNKNANYDNANSAPGTTNADYYCRSYAADSAGTTDDPKLVVVHSASAVVNSGFLSFM